MPDILTNTTPLIAMEAEAISLAGKGRIKAMALGISANPSLRIVTCNL